MTLGSVNVIMNIAFYDFSCFRCMCYYMSLLACIQTTVFYVDCFLAKRCGSVRVRACTCVFSNCSQLVATCGYQDIRVWNLNNHLELLRISVPNMHCYAITITVDGKSILSGQSIVYCTRNFHCITDVHALAYIHWQTGTAIGEPVGGHGSYFRLGLPLIRV